MIWTVVFGAFLLGASSVDANLALGKPATQRDDYLDGAKGWDASKAVDGNTDGNIYNNGCQHTGASDPNAPPAWWQVDLLESFSIGTIEIYNRVDCCSNRLQNTHILVGETDSIEDAVECDYIGEEGADAEVLAGACGVYGRYVTLLRDESGPEPHILNFCEITISGNSQNLALGKPASQRDDYLDGARGWDASKAVDGEYGEGNVYSNFCMHTGADPSAPPAWWQVDLLNTYWISSVGVHNRLDCCSNRLQQTHVLVGNTESIEDAVECGYFGSDVTDYSMTDVACDAEGRYVTLLRDESGPEPHILNICEVTVSGGA